MNGGGVLGYLRRLTSTRRAARIGMLSTIGLTVAAVAVVVARGWSGGDALGLVVGVLILGCLGSCAAVWLIESRASRDLEREVAMLARLRAGRDAGDTGEAR